MNVPGSVGQIVNGALTGNYGSINTSGGANGLFWKGADGNVWVSGHNGTNSAGAWDNNTGDYWQSKGFALINDPTPKANPAQNPQNDQSGAYTGGNGSVSTSQVNKDFVNKGFDSQIAGLQDKLRILDPQRQAGEVQLQNQYQTKFNDLNTSHAQGMRNLNMAEQQVQDSRVRGLDDLRRQAEQMSMGYNNQLGAYGAGDSSASQLLNRAVAGLTNKNRSNVLRNASDQATKIGIQKQDLQTSFDQNKRDLDAWKQNSITDLYNKYADEKAKIQQEMASADAQRYQQLAQYDAAYTQQALDALARIQQQHTQNANDLISRYQNMFAPRELSIAPELQQYTVKPIDAGTLGNISMPGAVNPESDAQMALRKRLDEQSGVL